MPETILSDSDRLVQNERVSKNANSVTKRQSTQYKKRIAQIRLYRQGHSQFVQFVVMKFCMLSYADSSFVAVGVVLLEVP